MDFQFFLLIMVITDYSYLKPTEVYILYLHCNDKVTSD